MNGDLAEATSGQAITLTLADEIDVSRGDVLTVPETPPLHTRQMVAHLVWFHDEPLQPEQSYLIKTATALIPGRITSVQHVVDVNTLEQKQAQTLVLNAIGVTRIELDRPAAIDPYRQNRDTGSFIVIDRFTNATVAAGMVIAAAPETVQEQSAGTGSKPDDKGHSTTRRINLAESLICSDEGNLVDLTAAQGELAFEVTPAFLDTIARGNRVLLRLAGPGQMSQVALLAYEHDLQFTFTRDGNLINLILFCSPASKTLLAKEDDTGL
jgi:sulfate adenylyltransferase subunit 1